MTRLFHLSEEKNIQKFIPRESKKQWGGAMYVWAISEGKIHNYLLPRDCPRICITTNKLDIFKEWIDTEKPKNRKAIIFVSTDWIEKIRNCTLYRCEFDNSKFTEIDKIAGYYVSSLIEVPIETTKINNCLRALEILNVELAIVDNSSLVEIKNKVVQNLIEFSVIKWSNFSME